MKQRKAQEKIPAEEIPDQNDAAYNAAYGWYGGHRSTRRRPLAVRSFRNRFLEYLTLGQSRERFVRFIRDKCPPFVENIKFNKIT